jgi:HlyD family secretion protein
MIIVGVVVVALVTAFTLRGGTRAQYFTAPVTRGDILDAVQATGTVNAVTTVQVGSQVSGTIAKLQADFNSRVHRGDIVALIDPRLFRGALLQSEADLESARANVGAAEADLAKAKATADQTKSDYERAIPLAQQDYVAQQALTDAKGTYEVARAAVDASAASLDQARAQVKLKEAAVAVARTNLEYTVIRSPIDGTVVARNVDVGQTVAASLQAPTIFTIAQDLTKMQLYAKTDESDVGRIRVGRSVTFKVDAFPKDVFHGVVSQIRMNATSLQNVVTYDTIIDFDNPDLKLFPGMTAYVTIPVASVTQVVEVPNTALRYRPALKAEEIRRLYSAVGIADSVRAAPRIQNDERGQQVRASGASTHREIPSEQAIVWTRDAGGTLHPVQLALGITDHAYTQVLAVTKGTLRVGDAVVTGSVAQGSGGGGGR